MGCEKTSIGRVPLDTDEEHGGEGLYGNGSNVAPHIEWGKTVGDMIKPLLPDGTPAERGGKIVFAGVGGMSNYFQWLQKMLELYRQEYGLTRRLTFMNLHKATFAAREIAIEKPDVYWDDPKIGVMAKLAKRNISPLQVQILWIGNTVRLQNKPFPANANEIELYMGMILDEALRRFPKTKQVFLSPVNYFGYALPGAPQREPHAYEEGYGYQSLINSRINHDRLPFVAWGPYLWADGLIPRPSDGLIWECEDYVTKDRVHPSESGKIKTAKMLLNFFKSNQATSRWFNGQ